MSKIQFDQSNRKHAFVLFDQIRTFLLLFLSYCENIDSNIAVAFFQLNSIISVGKWGKK